MKPQSNPEYIIQDLLNQISVLSKERAIFAAMARETEEELIELKKRVNK